MWPVQVVVYSPCLDELAGMEVASEQVLVETLVPEPSVEAFDKAVLHGLSRRDVMPFDAAVLLPSEHGV